MFVANHHSTCILLNNVQCRKYRLLKFRWNGNKKMLFTQYWSLWMQLFKREYVIKAIRPAYIDQYHHCFSQWLNACSAPKPKLNCRKNNLKWVFVYFLLNQFYLKMYLMCQDNIWYLYSANGIWRTVGQTVNTLYISHLDWFQQIVAKCQNITLGHLWDASPSLPNRYLCRCAGISQATGHRRLPFWLYCDCWKY